MPPPDHHKEVAKFLREKFGGDASISAYRDESWGRPIPIGRFSGSFISTIGAFDLGLSLPEGNYEFAATGGMHLLPNSIASSMLWLYERKCDSWPVICEDVVKHNAESTYRHMAYVPSPFGLSVSSAQLVNWLLGVPIRDNEIGVSYTGLLAKVEAVYPEWFFHEHV